MKDLDFHPRCLKPHSFLPNTFLPSIPAPLSSVSLVIFHPMTENRKRSCDDYFTSVLISSLWVFSLFLIQREVYKALCRELPRLFKAALPCND